MTSTIIEVPEESGRAPSRARRTRAPLRLCFSVVLSGVVCVALWQFVPSSLSVTTQIVGTPTFENFDYHRYFDAFDLVAVVFPVITFVLYQLQARFGPLAEARPRAALLPLRAAQDEGASAEPGHVFSRAARIGTPALVVWIEVSAGSIATRALSGVGLLAAALYVFGVLAIAALPLPGPLRRVVAGGYGERLALVNAISAVAVVPLLFFVSSATSVSVASPAHVVAYPWLPLWLAALCTMAIFCWLILRLRGGAAARALEGRLLVVVVGTLLVYLCVAGIPGSLGSFGGFDDAQYLAGAQLVFGHGLLPWKDIYLLHGMIEDVFAGQIGFGVFSHSRWGAMAGQAAIVYPVIFCVYYLFVAYFARRYPVAVALAAAVIVAGETTAVMRFVFLPLALIALERVLHRPSRGRCATLALLVVLEAICTPEIALMAVGIFGVVVAHDLASRRTDERWRAALVATRRTAITGAVCSLAWVLYLVATGSLGAFIDYFRVFGSDHALWGAFPLQWSLTGDPRTTAEFVMPIFLMLATLWRFVERARRRLPLSTRDWAMLAAASFVVLYFQKGLDRPDVGHVVEVFTVSMPLVLLWGIEGVEVVGDLWGRAFQRIPSGLARLRSGLVAAPSAAIVVAVGVVLLVAPQAVDAVRGAPAAFHATAPANPVLPLLGYENPGAVNTQEIENLGRIIDAYTPPGGPVFDFDNEPGIVYFLLNRVPGSRFFHVEEAETSHAQQEVIGEIAAARPNLVIFTASDFGLPTVDGIIGPVRNYLVSQYLLDHYAPFAEDNGQLVMIRGDLEHKVPPVSSLHLPGVVKGYRGLYFTSFSCDWGYVPNFLPSAPAGGVNVPISGGSAANTEITGWAVDDRTRGPVRTVIAVSHGTVIGTAHPNIYRLDIQQYFEKVPGWTAANAVSVRNAGFVLTLDLKPKQPVQVYAVNADGSLTRIKPTPPPAPRLPHGLAGGAARAVTFDGGSRPIESGSWLSGWLNSATSTSERVYTLRLPPGMSLAPYPTLTVTATGAIGRASFTLGDIPYDYPRVIEWNSLPLAGSAISVPAGSCLPWHGYSGPLQLIEQGGNPISSVRIGP